MNRVSVHNLGAVQVSAYFYGHRTRVPRWLGRIVSIRSIQGIVRYCFFNDGRYDTSGLRRFIFNALKVGFPAGSIPSFSCG